MILKWTFLKWYKKERLINISWYTNKVKILNLWKYLLINLFKDIIYYM